MIMLGNFYSKNQLYALSALVGIALLGITYAGLRHTIAGINVRDRMSVTDATGTDVSQSKVSSRSNATLVVHVRGSVRTPSVYTLRDGARVIDAIQAAGGTTPDANPDALNLAARVKDGDQITVPSKTLADVQSEVSAALTPPRTGSQPTPVSNEQPAQAIVNINTATAEELDALPGVGPATAQAIIEYRNQIGRFTSIQQLDAVKGIGTKKLTRMAPFVRI